MHNEQVKLDVYNGVGAANVEAAQRADKLC